MPLHYPSDNLTGAKIPRPEIQRFTVPLTSETFERFNALRAHKRLEVVALPEAGPGPWLLDSCDIIVERDGLGRATGGEIRVKAVAFLTHDERAAASLARENARVDAARAAVDRAPFVGLSVR